MRSVSFILLLAASVPLVPNLALAQPMLIDLGTLGGDYSWAYGVNDSGEVVGASNTVPGIAFTSGFLYSKGHMKPIIGMVEANAISNNGHVVGMGISKSHPGEQHAFMYFKGKVTDLGTLGGAASFAYGVNNHGDVVGYSLLPDNSTQHAFLYSKGKMIDLGSLGGQYSSAYSINDLGHIVGSSTPGADGTTHAFVYFDQTMTDLEPRSGIYSSYAYGINGNNQIVGVSEFTYNNNNTYLFDASLWANGTVADLGNLGYVSGSSVAQSINIHGQVVGSAALTGNTGHAFFYSSGKMKDLGTLGGENSIAYCINASSHVVGASETANGTTHAFLCVNPK